MSPPVINQSEQLRTPLSVDTRLTPFDFLRQFFLQPITTGAIAPSSRAVANKITSLIDFNKIDTLIELGPGTGVFTEQLVRNLKQDTTFFAIEINAAFAQATRRRCPNAKVYNDVASHLPHYLTANSKQHADCIVSGLPWTIFDAPEQDELLEIIAASLEPGATFISIVYLGANARARGRYFSRNLPYYFRIVESVGPVWGNLPPTMIYHCTR